MKSCLFFLAGLLCVAAAAQTPSTVHVGQPEPAQRKLGTPVNGQRISDHLGALSKFGANPQGGVSRVAYSEADLQGRSYITALLKEAGLDVHVDAAGNIIGTRAGKDP